MTEASQHQNAASFAILPHYLKLKTDDVEFDSQLAQNFHRSKKFLTESMNCGLNLNKLFKMKAYSLRFSYFKVKWFNLFSLLPARH